MATMMQFEVLSPDKYVYKAEDVTYVEATTVWGGVGILPHHATMIGTLKEAPLKYRDKQGNAHFICIDGGFLEVKNNKVTVLTVNAETADAIDVERARSSMERAKKRLEHLDKDINVERVMGSLHRAEARLQTVELAAKEK
jgi:F-type H+-transporting ATPase subunit epsilon